MKEHSVQGCYRRIKSSINSALKITLLVLVFFLTFGVNTSGVFAQTPRPIEDYLTLWGNSQSWGTPTKEALKKAEANGVGYFGPLPTEQGGFTSDGTLKKIKAVISLSIDQAKFREWNMVGARFESFLSNELIYTRLLDESFIVRIYQKDSSGKIIDSTVTLARVPMCTFIDCENSGQAVSGLTELANQGRPLSRVVKFASGGSMWADFVGGHVDGYNTDPQGEAPLSFTQAAIGGAAVGSVVPIPGVNWVTGAVLGLAANYLLDTDGPVLVMRQTAVVDLPVDSALEKGKPAYMELWYLGSDRMTTEDDSFEPAAKASGWYNTHPYPDTGNERIKYFDIKLQHGYDNKKYPFFQIGGVYEFTTPASVTDAQTQASEVEQDIATTGGNLQTNDNKEGFLPACDILNGWRIVGSANGTFMGCIAQLTYYAIYRPVAWVAGLMGELFDFFLGYSLADDSYRASFAVAGWKLVRDISNIFFIIILIWTGLATVFNFGGISMKKVVPALIINALLINFSLFGTQVVIDLSNVTARIFYNSTQVCAGKCEDKNNDGSPDNTIPSAVGGYKSLSVAITSGFNPQRLFDPSVLNSAKAVPAKGTTAVVNGVGSDKTSETTKVSDDTEVAGYFIIVCLIAAIIMFGVAKMFWATAFMFLGRVIGIYTVMIFSPFAVMTRGKMPLVSKIEDLSWDSWLKDLTSYALLAPIFVFFLYIISAFITSGFMDVTMGTLGDSFLENVLHIAIPMLIVYFMINQGVSIAKKYAGKIGIAVQNWSNAAAGKVVGFGTGAAIGVATGGAALVGRGAMSALGKTGLGTWAATNKDNGGIKGFIAGGTNRFMQWGQKTSFDVRNTKLGGLATGGISTGLGKLGIKMKDNVSGNIKLGQKDYIGGNVKIRADRLDRKVKKIERKNDMSHLSDKQAAKVWGNRTKKMTATAGEKAWEEGTLAALIASNGKEAELNALKDVGKTLADGLKTATESGNKEQVKTITQKIDENTKAQTAITAPLVAQVVKQKKEFGENIKETELYKKGEAVEKERLSDKYGKVENAKDLSAALRNEYALRMIEDSLTLSKGKKRWWQPPAVGGALGTLGVLGVGLGTGALAGGLLANYIDSLQQSDLEAAKKVIKSFDKYKKQFSKQDRIKDLNNELTKIDDLIEEHIAEVMKMTLEDVKKLTDEKKEEHFNTVKGRVQQAVDLSKDAYDKAIAKYKKITMPTEIDQNELNKATDEYYKKVDLYNRVKDAYKNKRIYTDALEREEDRIATDEERAKSAADREAAKKAASGS